MPVLEYVNVFYFSENGIYNRRNQIAVPVKAKSRSDSRVFQARGLRITRDTGRRIERGGIFFGILVTCLESF